MDSKLLCMGTAKDSPFTLPAEAQVETFAVIGKRGSGKTVCATVMAEEFCKLGLPWICFDPVSVWWGLRADRNGKPGGYPVLILGGKRGDLPIDKNSGRRVAEAILKEPLCVVIDVKLESKKFWHTFMTDLALGLMDAEPDAPRHVFVEEAPEFVPQSTKVDLTARCKEAVERLVRLGRNQGYGCTLISQRPAIIDKDVLSQCESLFVFRTMGSHDYKALEAWLKAALGTDDSQRNRMKDLAKLPSGTGYFWSPAWRNKFLNINIRERETFHPGETRKVGAAVSGVSLSPVNEAVTRLSKLLTKVSVPVPASVGESSEGLEVSKRSKPNAEAPRMHPESVEELENLRKENERLRSENHRLRGQLNAAVQRVEGVKRMLEPEYNRLKALFDELGGSTTGGLVDRAKYEPWLNRAGKRGCRRMLETLLERHELMRAQLATLSGIGPTTQTFKNYLSWLKTNGLVDVNGDTVALRRL